MNTIEANKLIVKLQKDLAESGIVKGNLVKDLKKLREFALEEEDPTVTKVTRLTYEHIAEHGTFNIPIPSDEEIEGEELVLEEIDENDFDAKRDSLNYLFSLMLDRNKPANQQDLFEYRDALKAY